MFKLSAMKLNFTFDMSSLNFDFKLKWLYTFKYWCQESQNLALDQQVQS